MHKETIVKFIIDKTALFYYDNDNSFHIHRKKCPFEPSILPHLP